MVQLITGDRNGLRRTPPQQMAKKHKKLVDGPKFSVIIATKPTLKPRPEQRARG